MKDYEAKLASFLPESAGAISEGAYGAAPPTAAPEWLNGILDEAAKIAVTYVDEPAEQEAIADYVVKLVGGYLHLGPLQSVAFKQVVLFGIRQAVKALGS